MSSLQQYLPTLQLTKPNLKSCLRLSLLLLLLTIIILFPLLHLDQKLQPLFLFIQQHAYTPIGFLIYYLIFILFSILSIPISLLGILCGFIYRPYYLALLILESGVVLGCTLGFLAGRKVFREYIKRKYQSTQIYQLLDSSISKNGFKMGLLIRLAQIIPFGIGTYLLSITSITYPQFLLSTLLGTLPGYLFTVYLGTLLNDLKDMNGVQKGGKMFKLGLLMMLSFLLPSLMVMTCFARRIWRDSIKRHQLQQQSLEQESLGQQEGFGRLPISTFDTLLQNEILTDASMTDSEGEEIVEEPFIKFTPKTPVPSPLLNPDDTQIEIIDTQPSDVVGVVGVGVSEPFTRMEKGIMVVSVVGCLLSLSIGLPLILTGE